MPKKKVEFPSLKSVMEAAEPHNFSFKRNDCGSDQSVKITAVVEELIVNYRNQAAKGDPEALSMLHRIGIMASVALMQVMAKQKKMVKAYAEQQLGWPVLITGSGHQNQSFLELVKDLNLGSKTDTVYDPAKIYKTRIPVKRIALILQIVINHLCRHGWCCMEIAGLRKRLLANPSAADDKQLKRLLDDESDLMIIQQALGQLAKEFGTRRDLGSEAEHTFTLLCLQLPPLTRETSKQWWDVAHKLFLHLTDDQPESAKKFPKLRQVGIYRKDHSQSTEDTAEVNIRDGIIRSIKAAFVRQLRVSGSAEPSAT